MGNSRIPRTNNPKLCQIIANGKDLATFPKSAQRKPKYKGGPKKSTLTGTKQKVARNPEYTDDARGDDIATDDEVKQNDSHLGDTPQWDYHEPPRELSDCAAHRFVVIRQREARPSPPVLKETC